MRLGTTLFTLFACMCMVGSASAISYSSNLHETTIFPGESKTIGNFTLSETDCSLISDIMPIGVPFNLTVDNSSFTLCNKSTSIC